MRVLDAIVAVAAIIHAIQYSVKFYRWWQRKRPDVMLTSAKPRDLIVGISMSILCALIWSLSYVSLSYVTTRVDPFAINVIVLGLAACFLFAAYVAVRIYHHIFGHTDLEQVEPSVSWRTTTPWITAIGNLGNFALFIYALYFISASQAITLGQTYPVFVALLTSFWLRRPLPKSAIAATALAVFGALLIVAEKDTVVMGSAATYGSIMALGGGVAFALFSTGLEKIERSQLSLTSSLSFMGISFSIAYLGAVSLAYFAQKMPATIDSQAWLILGVNGLRVAVVYLLYAWAVKCIGALLVSILVALQVPFTLLWDARLLHHHPLPKLIIGAVAILIAASTLATDRFRAMRGGGVDTLDETTASRLA